MKSIRVPSIFFAFFGFAATAAAHPMGNFSISHYSALHIGGGEIRLRYRVDIAELPSVEEMRELDSGNTDKIAEALQNSYLQHKSAEFISNLRLTINGQPVSLSIVKCELHMRPGAANLPTLLISVDCRAGLPPLRDRNLLEYRDDNYPQRAGWKEIIATFGGGVVPIESNVGTTDLTQGLERYPTDLTIVPPQQLSARVLFGPSASTQPAQHASALESSATTSRAATPRDRFTQLISSKDMSLGFLLFAMGVAFLLGSMHAMAPGHGKTIVAAYLVGSHGRARHAFLLGAVVTFTHVAGVFLLGFVVLFISKYIVPERLYPWLGLASGMTITLVGAQQFVQRRAAPAATDWHDPAPRGHVHALPARITPAGLIALGVSGGMVPCPSALVVLLGAIALHRTGFGLLLILAFSGGLASVLIATGLLMVVARRGVERLTRPGEGLSNKHWSSRLIRYAPLASSAALATIGAGIAFQSLMSMRH